MDDSFAGESHISGDPPIHIPNLHAYISSHSVSSADDQTFFDWKKNPIHFLLGLIYGTCVIEVMSEFRKTTDVLAFLSRLPINAFIYDSLE